MGRTIRFGISLGEGLLESFDRLIREKGYQNRSEAIRDLIRDSLVREEASDLDSECVGTITLVYSHHTGDLPERLTELQHRFYSSIVSTLHVHLDEENCLEVLIIRGKGRDIKAISDMLIATKGVKHGRLVITTTGKGLE